MRKLITHRGYEAEAITADKLDIEDPQLHTRDFGCILEWFGRHNNCNFLKLVENSDNKQTVRFADG